jgi:uncharacterized protein (TIGR00251 family)
MRDDTYLVRLNAPPVDGAANTELIAVLADVLGVPKRAVTIVSGAKNRTKTIRVDGLTAAQVSELLNTRPP